MACLSKNLQTVQNGENMNKLLKTVLAIMLSFAMIVTAVSTLGNEKKASAATKTSMAAIQFTDFESCQVWNNGTEIEPIIATKATITGAGEYTAGLDFTATTDGYAKTIKFCDLEVVQGETLFPGYTLRIDKVLINGQEVTFSKGYTTSDNGVDTRVNIFNSWASVTDNSTSRSYDGNLKDATPNILNPDLYPEVKTIQVTFTYIEATSNTDTKSSLEKGKKFTAGDYTYVVTGTKKVSVNSVAASAKKKTSLTVPATVTKSGIEYRVTGIASKALKGNATIKKVTLGKNVSTIGVNAFSDCKNLTSFVCNGKLTSVSKNAFKGCGKLKLSGKNVKENKSIIKKSGATIN